jgi:isoleucyl-tRNA synthetase
MLAEWWETSDGKQRFLTEAEARDALGPAGFTRKIGKMSKQLRNYRPPEQIFDTYGADALRWYFFANQAPWNSIIYSEQAIKESIPEFLLRLWNVYSFFVIYANIDGFDPARLIGGAQQTDPAARGTEVPHYEHAGVPDYERPNELTSDVLARAEGYTPIAQRSELDRWILSELNRTAAEVTKRMDAYDNFGACGQITAFVDALSNWYVRRSRDRFWSSEQSADKRDAYWTLYECLLTTSKIIAPFVPFLAEALWQNLAVEPFCSRHAPRDESEPGKGQFVAQASSLPKHVAQSVHLCTFPSGIAAVIDEGLSARMNLVREIVSLGRSARMQASLKVRQPLAKVEVILTDRRHLPWLEAHSALVCEELNVKEVDYAPAADQYIDYTVLPDLKRLGPRLGKRLPALRKALAEADAAALLAELNRAGKVELQLADGPVGLDSEDLQVRLQAKPGWAAAQGACGVVVLSTELTPDLVAEGLAREFVHAVQTIRKEISCDYTDRLELGIVTASDELRKAIEQFAGYIKAETLAVQLVFEALPGVEGAPMKLAGHEVTIYVKRLPQSR